MYCSSLQAVSISFGNCIHNYQLFHNNDRMVFGVGVVIGPGVWLGIRFVIGTGGSDNDVLFNYRFFENCVSFMIENPHRDWSIIILTVFVSSHGNHVALVKIRGEQRTYNTNTCSRIYLYQLSLQLYLLLTFSV